ncbi:hypothetical protein [Thermococcus indicus]|nr:hypothetical protein [Thermococcus indicus]
MDEDQGTFFLHVLGLISAVRTPVDLITATLTCVGRVMPVKPTSTATGGTEFANFIFSNFLNFLNQLGGLSMYWIVRLYLKRLANITSILFVLGLVYYSFSPSTTPAMTYSLFIFILAFPLCSMAFENTVFELKNPVSRVEYSLAMMISYLIALLIPLVPFALSKHFLSAVLVVVSGVSAGLFIGSLGLGPKLSLVLPILFILTFVSLLRLSPLLSLWNPLLSSYRGVFYQLISISIYSSLYFVVMKKREWRA